MYPEGGSWLVGMTARPSVPLSSPQSDNCLMHGSSPPPLVLSQTPSNSVLWAPGATGRPPQALRWPVSRG